MIKARLLFEDRHPDEKSKAPKLYGQELNPVTYAMAKMNVFLHDYTNASIAIGDTFRSPKFAAKGAGLQRFDYVVRTRDATPADISLPRDVNLARVLSTPLQINYPQRESVLFALRELTSYDAGASAEAWQTALSRATD